MHQFLYECSEYINEADGNLLYKSMPVRPEPVSKVKLRKRTYANAIDKFFDITFMEERDARQRSLIANTLNARSIDTERIYYVFPINGYSYMFNTHVMSLTEEYTNVLLTMGKNNTESVNIEILQDLLIDNYQSTNLIEAFERACEVMFYNIPYYYAVEQQYYDDNQIVLSSVIS